MKMQKIHYSVSDGLLVVPKAWIGKEAVVILKRVRPKGISELFIWPHS